ncbi:flagellar filament capping protein FliD [Sphingomonas sp. TREG-RG-20F-R18-01]|uniref:flagellar filament capping protein FliD n=1 Tax=Sphingomonas sp. TREG-RG-20F-R18-01 TaxID=2914982 RepID=UPI001F58D774|nr:flagellar filament capping protein FliD [Sphingomonas sp. TREG-RG-20F-R18-01]
MTTTTSATSATPTPTPTSTTTIGQSLINGLNAGSGVDTASLVASLTQAQFASKNLQLTKQDTALTAQISSVAKVQSAITSFASGLTTLVKGGSLQTQPASSDTGVLTASALPGAKLSGLSAFVEVTQLASAQTSTSTTRFDSRSATVGTGTLTLTLGTASDSAVSSLSGAAAPVSITIDSTNNTLDGIAKAINAANSGVSATIVTDVDGKARLTLKGPTGTDKAFTLSGDSGSLAQLNVGGSAPASTITGSAGNAKLSLNGTQVERSSNTISDLVDGVQLTLSSVTAAGKPVVLGSSTPTAGLTQAVGDFVDTYNQLLAELKTETDASTGPLKSDYNATNLMRALRGMTLTTLTTGGAAGSPSTLAAIGVKTNKDGTLSVDQTQLSAALTKTPDAVEAMFADGTGATGGGIAAALNAISTAAVSNKITVNGRTETTGLVASTALYTAAKTKVAVAEDKVTSDTAAYQERLTKQYAASDAKVAAYKATQTQLQNQIDQWNKSGQ